MAGLLTLPLHLATALAVTVYAHTYTRAHRRDSARPYRLVFSAAATVLAIVTAGRLYHALDGHIAQAGPTDSLLIVTVIAVYTCGNLLVLLTGMYIVTKPARWQAVLPGKAQVSYENTTLLLGALTGVLIHDAQWLSPVVLILVAITHRSSLVADLTLAATRDSKTDLLNSRAWHALAESQLALCQVTGADVALLLIDLDHFKNVNDTFGHLAGDAVLRTVANILTAELRDYDALGRYGGEEFIVLLPAVDRHTATAIADRLCLSIRDHTATSAVPVTVSIGVTSRRCRPSTTIEDYIRSADLAMYEAKHAGRDRISVAQ